MTSELTRRELLRLAGLTAAGGALVAAGCGNGPAQEPPRQAEQRAIAPTATPAGVAALAIAHGPDPAAITVAAVAALGGMGRFVKRGADVIVKPNICTDYHGPEYASTTNPVVVATLVKLALQAGAKRVRVMDNPFGGTAAAAYAKSGIAAAVEAAGGRMEVMSPTGFASFDIPRGRSIKSWEFYRDILTADTVINVPIAKDHGSTRLTLGCKNIMGTVLDRGGIHADLSQRIADLVSLVRPQLTVVDAVRILISGGPTGGDLSAVRKLNTVIASPDIVAADAYATSLFGLKPADVAYIGRAAAMGLGRISPKKSEIKKIAV